MFESGEGSGMCFTVLCRLHQDERESGIGAGLPIKDLDLIGHLEDWVVSRLERLRLVHRQARTLYLSDTGRVFARQYMEILDG
jgi:hypothetical protein